MIGMANALNFAKSLARAAQKIGWAAAGMTLEDYFRLVPVAIAMLVAVHIVGAAMSSPSPTRPEKPVEEPGKTPRPSSIPGENCIVMPDGVRVCDPGESFSASAPGNLESDGSEEACGFFGLWHLPNTLETRDPSPRALLAVESIVKAVGLVSNFKVVEADFDKDNWAYAITRWETRYIVYDKKRFHWDTEHPRWDDVAVLAHEIGHHLNGHTVDGKIPYWRRELEADRFAGFAVSRLGGSLENALLAYRGMSAEGTKTHPPRAQRLEAVEAGWRHAEALKKQEPVSCATRWLADSFDLRGQSCRMARVCRGKTPGYRLACEQDGRWFWTNRSAE